MKDKRIHTITKDSFDEYRPTKNSFARCFWSLLNRMSADDHKVTHEEVFYKLESDYIDLFGEPPLFKSFEGFKKHNTRHNIEIHR